MVRIDTSILFTMTDTARTHGHDLKVFKKRPTRLARRNAFSQRIVNDCNTSKTRVCTPAINNFKNQLDKFLVSTSL